MPRANDLIERILSDARNDDNADLPNELLEEFLQGYPLEALQQLLSSENDNAVKTGIYIAQRLGAKASPLLQKVVKLRGDKFIRLLLSDPDSNDDGVLVNNLLDEFHRGYPLEAIQPLLSSQNEKVLAAGVFIASELGQKATPILGEVAQFLLHPNQWVRSDVIGCVLVCATGKDAGLISKVVSMLNDPDGLTRWRVMDFLSKAPAEKLQAAITHFEQTDASSPHVSLLRWLLSDHAHHVDEVASLLQSENPLARKYAAAAAARIALAGDRSLLLASRSQDDDVKGFAKNRLRNGEKSASGIGGQQGPSDSDCQEPE
jgi:hypothetical protein